jgi:hypothetical protein
MCRIAEVLGHAGVDFVDAGLKWGAKASYYETSFTKAVADGFTPVLVELEIDCPVPEGAVVVDHHGERSSQPPSLLQALTLIGVTPTRKDLVIAANDAGWWPALLGQVDIPGMGKLYPPATPDELEWLAATSMAANGLSQAQIAECRRALAAPIEMIGAVRVIRQAHSKTGPIGDALAIEAISAGATSPDEFPPYLVLSEDGEVNFSGDGGTASALYQAFPGGWTGGAGLGDPKGSAYWGGYPNQDVIMAFLKERFEKK